MGLVQEIFYPRTPLGLICQPTLELFIKGALAAADDARAGRAHAVADMRGIELLAAGQAFAPLAADLVLFIPLHGLHRQLDAGPVPLGDADDCGGPMSLGHQLGYPVLERVHFTVWGAMAWAGHHATSPAARLASVRRD